MLTTVEKAEVARRVAIRLPDALALRAVKLAPRLIVIAERVDPSKHAIGASLGQSAAFLVGCGVVEALRVKPSSAGDFLLLQDDDRTCAHDSSRASKECLGAT